MQGLGKRGCPEVGYRVAALGLFWDAGPAEFVLY